MSLPLTSEAAGLARRTQLVRQIRFLVVFTIAYNLLEGGVALVAGAVASSTALLGFGLDSLVEVASALGVAWQFAGRDDDVRVSRERIALRITSCAFFALAGFIAYHSFAGLFMGQTAHHSTTGIVVAALSLVIMPLVSWLQRRAGHQLGSNSAVADSKQTLLCTYMSAVLLIGLVANSQLGWWWADPAAAFGIAALAVREGINAWRGDVCCPPAEALFEHHDLSVSRTTCNALDRCCDARPKRILGGPHAAEPKSDSGIEPRTGAPSPTDQRARAESQVRTRVRLRRRMHNLLIGAGSGPTCSKPPKLALS